MRSLKFSLSVAVIMLACGALPVAAEDPPNTCSANSADKTQSCSVTCPQGKTATCVGGAQGAKDVDCTCK